MRLHSGTLKRSSLDPAQAPKKLHKGLTVPRSSPKVLLMIKSFLTAGLMVASLSPLGMAEELKLETETAKASYLIGRNIGESLQADGLELDLDLLHAGLKEAAAGTESQISDADAQAVMMKFQQDMQAKQAAMQAEAAAANAAEGTAFLEENGKREGVTTTESGLQYEVITAAEGPKPAASDTVQVHYHGTLIDGTVFDSSVDRGEPIDFPLNGVIRGWTEGVQLMSVGSKYKFYIPADLAYGDRGSPPRISPGAALVFEVELLSIAEKPEAAPAAPEE